MFPRSFKIMNLSSPTSSNGSNNSKSTTTTTGCVTAILSKILCSSSLPKDPSNQIEELESSKSVITDKDQNFIFDASSTTTSTPGIVARLMGLESMGEIQIPSYASKPISLSRSKSMNHVDYLGEECNQMQAMHKRVNSTLSFREVPNFLKNDNFLVLSFENGGESSDELFKSNGRKKQIGCDELKQKVNKLKENKRENVLIEKGKLSKKGSCGNVGYGLKLQDMTNNLMALAEKKCFGSQTAMLSQPMKYKEVVIGKKQKRRKKKTVCYTEKIVETECKLEDSSPVSVLDFESESCGPDRLSSRRILTPELENEGLLHSDGNLMIGERKDKANGDNKYEGSKKKEKLNMKYTHIWGEVYKLTEDESGGTNQVTAWMNKQCDLGSISAEFELEIFDHLLNELIDEFVGSPLTGF